MAAFKEVNDVGGVRGNYTFDLIAYDDQYEPSNTTTNTQRLLTEDAVFALMGYVGTPTSLGMLLIICYKRISILITCYVYHDFVTRSHFD